MAKTLKGTGSFKGDATPFSKDKQKMFKGALGLNKPKPDTSAQEEALAAQRLQQAELDSEENRRRKRLLAAATGARAFTGSPLFRATPGNTATAAVGTATGGTVRPSSVPRGGGRSMIP